jgi:hypothetical protein
MMSIIPPISTKRTITSHLKSLNIKQTMTCRDGHPGPGLVQAQKCWSYLQVNGISKGNTIKNCTDSLQLENTTHYHNNERHKHEQYVAFSFFL